MYKLLFEVHRALERVYILYVNVCNFIRELADFEVVRFRGQSSLNQADAVSQILSSPHSVGIRVLDNCSKFARIRQKQIPAG